MEGSDQTALIVTVPEVEALVGPFRAQHDPASAQGVPAHVTVVYPFLPPRQISEHVLESLRDIFTALPEFVTTFSGTRRFPGVLYLAPLPDTPFRRLTDSVVRVFPSAPPYGGQFSDVVPHLTVAHATDLYQLEIIAAKFAAAANGSLPIRVHVRDVTLIEKRNGEWRTRMHLPLGEGGVMA